MCKNMKRSSDCKIKSKIQRKISIAQSYLCVYEGQSEAPNTHVYMNTYVQKDLEVHTYFCGFNEEES